MNKTTEIRKVRTTPKRVIRKALTGTEMPFDTAKEVMTQVPWSALTPRLPAMVGIDTLAIEPSSTCMKVPSASAIAATASAPPFSGARSVPVWLTRPARPHGR